MNCMLVGVYDRYILIDAGLMYDLLLLALTANNCTLNTVVHSLTPFVVGLFAGFQSTYHLYCITLTLTHSLSHSLTLLPSHHSFSDLGMQKILPDTSFLAQWRDRIEAVVITHGHEDHIGALPWVVPALDPATPIYAGGMSMQLIKRRLQEFNLWDQDRMHILNMRKKIQMGPFEVEPVRVTHSIPDCCGLVLRSEHGTIFHTGDWKIDENPVDGEEFDRQYFEELGKDGVALFMSDSTNVLSPGRTTSERDVEEALIRRVMGHAGQGRIITTQFASNLHRLASVKKAADAAGRKICFIGMSLNTYLEAAWREGRAPMDPRELVPSSAVDDMDPNELLIVTTGSQAEPRAALSLASRGASHLLKLRPSDLLLYSAKVIPGNDTKVVQMMNRIAELGPEIAMGRDEGLHTSGHAYRGELEEALQMVRPQHFLPVHGEYAFLCAHAQLARETGVRNTSVIRNGQMLGVHELRSRNTLSSGPSAKILGEAKLVNFYNDGNKGTGTMMEMALEQRQLLAVEGIVIAAVDVLRDASVVNAAVTAAGAPGDGAAQAAAAQAAARRKLKAKIRITTRAMWTDNGRLLEQLHGAADQQLGRLPGDATLSAVERVVSDALRRCAKQFNNRRPEVVVIAHEADPRAGAAAAAAARRRIDRGSPSLSDQEAGALMEEKRLRKRQQREKDLLFAGKGGEVEELGTAEEDGDSDVSEGEEDVEGVVGDDGSSIAGKFGRRGGARISMRRGAGNDGGKPLPPLRQVPPDFIRRRQQANPRDNPPPRTPGSNDDLAYD